MHVKLPLWRRVRRFFSHKFNTPENDWCHINNYFDIHACSRWGPICLCWPYLPRTWTLPARNTSGRSCASNSKAPRDATEGATSIPLVERLKASNAKGLASGNPFSTPCTSSPVSELGTPDRNSQRESPDRRCLVSQHEDVSYGFVGWVHPSLGWTSSRSTMRIE